MKAIFEHNGFTRMEELPTDPPQTYAIPVTPPITMAYDPVDMVNVVAPNVDIWQFELHGIEYVDNEYVAIYKYSGKR